MKKVINDQLILYFNGLFPYKSTRQNLQCLEKNNTVTIGIGGNIGDVSKRFKLLFKMLLSDSRFALVSSSPILKNPPFGYLDQDDFFNAIIVLKTNLSPINCLDAFQRYEYRFKRTRSFQDAPRTLDIDIIFYNNVKMNSKRLILPHKGYKDRASVLIPLCYVTKQNFYKINYSK